MSIKVRAPFFRANKTSAGNGYATAELTARKTAQGLQIRVQGGEKGEVTFEVERADLADLIRHLQDAATGSAQ